MPGAKGKSGRKPKPSAERQSLGCRRGTIGKNLPTPPRTRSYLDGGLDDVALSFFRYYEPILYNSGILTDADGTLLYAAAVKYSLWFNAAAEAAKRKPVIEIKDKWGAVVDLKRTPYTKIEAEYFDQLCSALRELGMTPLGRSAISKIGIAGNAESKLKRIT
jgi:phage terminase small subunit